jgi:hypothetical protein
MLLNVSKPIYVVTLRLKTEHYAIGLGQMNQRSNTFNLVFKVCHDGAETV